MNKLKLALVLALFCAPLSAQTKSPQPAQGKQERSGKQPTNWYSFRNRVYQQPLVYLLANPNYQTELELSEEQRDLVRDLSKRLREGYAKVYAEFPELRDPKLDSKKRMELNQRLQARYKELQNEIDMEMKDILVPTQLEAIGKLQFNQSVQYYGFSATVSNAPFKEQLRTTDDQAKKLKKIRDETEQEILKLIEEKRKAAKARMLKVFSAEQRKKLKDLEGQTKMPRYTRL